MNRNVLFRKTLLASAVVAVLNTYSVGAVAAACPDPTTTVDGKNTVVVAADSSCDSITISVDNLATDIEIGDGGSITGNITNSAELEYLKVDGGDETSATVSGDITNSGTLNDGTVPDPDGSGNFPNDDGLYIEGTTANGRVINSQTGTITAFDSGIEINNSEVNGITNSGNIFTNGWYSYGISSTGSIINGDLVNEGDINSQGDGIHVGSSSNLNGSGSIKNSGNISSAVNGIHVSNSGLAGSIENSGNISTWETGISVESSSVTGNVANKGEILANTGISLTATSSVSDIINEQSGWIEADIDGIVLDGATANSIVNSGSVNAHDGDGISLKNSSSVNSGINNSYDILAKVNGISISAGSNIGMGTFNSGSVSASIFNSGYISGYTAGIHVSSGATIGSTAIINEGSIDGYFGIIIDSLNAATTIVNEGTIHSNNPNDANLPGLSLDNIPIFEFGVDHEDGGGFDHEFGEDDEFPGNGDASPGFEDLFPVPPGGEPTFSMLNGGDNHNTDETLSHAIYSVDSTNALTVNNEGSIYGRVFGPKLTLNNSGTFKTLPGSDIESYTGSGTLVAVLNDKLLAIGEAADDSKKSSVLEADTVSFGAGSKILVDSNFLYGGDSVGKNYVIVQETGGDSDIAGDGNGGDDINNIITIESASILLDVTRYNDVTNDKIAITVTSKNAGNVIAQIGAPVSIQLMVNEFLSFVLPGLDDNSALAQLFESALRGSDKSLLELTEALEPETSGSSAAGATITQSASFGSVSTRTSSSRTGTNSGDLFQDGGIWAQYLHSKGKQDHRAESDGFDSRLNGITFGVDGDINDHWTLGVALTAADVTTSSTGSSSVTDTTSYIGTLYGSWQNNDRFVDIMASAGLSKNETEGILFTDQITSEYDANQLGLRLVTGQDFWLDSQAMVLQPNLSFNYGRVDVEAYEESGSSLAREYKKQRYEVIELGAGITAMKSFELDRGLLDTSLSLNVFHDFAADQVEIQSRFLAGGGFIANPGAEPEKTTWQASLGLNYQISNTLSASVNYDHTWKSTFAADSASIKLRYDF